MAEYDCIQSMEVGRVYVIILVSFELKANAIGKLYRYRFHLAKYACIQSVEVGRVYVIILVSFGTTEAQFYCPISRDILG